MNRDIVRVRSSGLMVRREDPPPGTSHEGADVAEGGNRLLVRVADNRCSPDLP